LFESIYQLVLLAREGSSELFMALLDVREEILL
jgi:hypothetical protein